MLGRQEHRQVLGGALRASQRLTRSHRTALDVERAERRAERARLADRPHRAVLHTERQRLVAMRTEHKEAAEQMRWLVNLAAKLTAAREARRGPQRG